MNAFLFISLAVLIVYSYMYNHVIAKFLSQFDKLKNITSIHINQIVTVILIIIVLIAGFSPSGSKKKFASISENYENIRTPVKTQRPNPMFDINTYF